MNKFVVFVNKISIREGQACHSSEIVGLFSTYEDAKKFVESSDVVPSSEFDEEVGISEIPASIFEGGVLSADTCVRESAVAQKKARRQLLGLQITQ